MLILPTLHAYIMGGWLHRVLPVEGTAPSTDLGALDGRRKSLDVVGVSRLVEQRGGFIRLGSVDVIPSLLFIGCVLLFWRQNILRSGHRGKGAAWVRLFCMRKRRHGLDSCVFLSLDHTFYFGAKI